MLGSEPYIRVGRKVEHNLLAGHRTRKPFLVPQVCLYQIERGVTAGPSQELMPPGRKVVIHRNSVPNCQQAIHKRAANKARTAGHKYFHVLTPPGSMRAIRLSIQAGS